MRKSEEQAVDLPPRKPDEVARQEFIYRKYVKRKIEEGIKAAEEGGILSHDEVKRLFAR